MRAYVIRRYGGPEQLSLEDVDVPATGRGQIRVRMHAASINSADVRLMRADPFIIRLFGGLFRPKRWPILGSDFAGVVEEVGEGVETFAVGDRVFGNSFRDENRAFAEKLVVRAEDAVHIPEGVDFADAAAVPMAGLTALQALRDEGRVGEGSSVLIQGAGGGVGNAAVQIARHLKAHVTAVCGPGSLELMERWGADHVIDYTQRNFTEEDQCFDVIVGVNGYHPIGRYKERLKSGGRYVMVGGGGRQLFQAMLLGPLLFALSDKSCSALQIDDERRSTDFTVLRDLVAQGELTLPLDRRFAFGDLPEAMGYVEGGHVKGKVIIDFA